MKQLREYQEEMRDEEERSQTDAETAYNKTKQQVGQELYALMGTLARQPRDISWGDVGDMNYILSQIKQLNGEE